MSPQYFARELARRGTRVEAIDLASRTLAASTQFGGVFSILPSGHVFVLQAVDGAPRISIGRLTLKRG